MKTTGSTVVVWHARRLPVTRPLPSDCLQMPVAKHVQVGIDCFTISMHRPVVSKLCVTELCGGNPPVVTSGFPLQRASNAQNILIWWRHHAHYHVIKINVKLMGNKNIWNISLLIMVQFLISRVTYLCCWYRTCPFCQAEFGISHLIHQWHLLRTKLNGPFISCINVLSADIH